MLVNIVSWTIFVVFSLPHVLSEVNGARKRPDDLPVRTADEEEFGQITIKRNQTIYPDQLENGTHVKPNEQLVVDKNIKIRIKKINNITTVSYSVDTQSSPEDNVIKRVKKSTKKNHNDFYDVTAGTTVPYVEYSRSSTEESVDDDNVIIQEKNSTKKMNHNDFYNVTTRTTVSYFVDSERSTEEIVDNSVPEKNSNEIKHNDFGKVTTINHVSTTTTVADAKNITNNNKTNMTLKDTWIKRRGLFILIPAVLVLTAGVIALLVWRRINIAACFSKRGSYDVQGGFLRLNTCERSQYDSFEHVHFIPHE